MVDGFIGEFATLYCKANTEVTFIARSAMISKRDFPPCLGKTPQYELIFRSHLFLANQANRTKLMKEVIKTPLLLGAYL